VANALLSYVGYVGQFFYPVGLTVCYLRPGPHLPWWQVAAACAILAIVTAATICVRRKCPYLAVGWLWYLAMLLPVIGLLQIGCTATADRFTYLPQVGLAIALVWGAADLCRAWPFRRCIGGVAAAALLAVLLGAAFRQTSFWSDSVTLWSRALAGSSQNCAAHRGMGGALLNDDRPEEASAHFRQAIAIQPDYLGAHMGLADILMDGDRPDEAEKEYREVVRLDPRNAVALERLGLLAAKRGRTEEAIAYLRRSLESNPGNADTCYDLAKVLLQCGRREESRQFVKKAMAAVPDYVAAHENLGLIMAGHGQLNGAIKHFERALDGDPRCRSARLNLGRALGARGRFDEAVAQVRTVLQFDPRDAEASDLLARLLDKEKEQKATAPQQIPASPAKGPG
jgi:tetratricopeptide (TPR) repeat protein